MWKIFKTSFKLMLTIWLVKSIWNDISDSELKQIFKQLNNK